VEKKVEKKPVEEKKEAPVAEDPNNP